MFTIPLKLRRHASPIYNSFSAFSIGASRTLLFKTCSLAPKICVFRGLESSLFLTFVPAPNLRGTTRMKLAAYRRRKLNANAGQTSAEEGYFEFELFYSCRLCQEIVKWCSFN